MSKIINMNQFSKKIIDWQKRQGRNNLPWQKKSAYEVWISEIMLQQTQVETVIPYYEKFISTFPEIKTLAESSEDQVMSLWSGLGYYSRARNIHKSANGAGYVGRILLNKINLMKKIHSK